MNILRSARPDDDERIYPAGFVSIGYDSLLVFGIGVWTTLHLRVPFNVPIDLAHVIVTNVLEPVEFSQGLTLDVLVVETVDFQQGLGLRINGADSGVVMGDYYFAKELGIV